MESLLVGLFLAGVSALAFIAYNHHEIYLKYHKYLVLALYAIFAGVTIWHFSSSYTYLELVPLLGKDKLDESKDALESINIPMKYSLGMFLFLNVYFLFLRNLPFLLKKSASKRE